MLDHGHPQAYDYPIARIWEEVELVVERQDRLLANLSVVIQKATATTGMTASKEQVEKFNEFVRMLVGE